MIRILAVCLLIIGILQAQTPTPAAERLDAQQKRAALTQNSITAAMPAKSVGPTVYSCRVTDLDVNPQDPSEFFVAYASGGLWHTNNNGQTFKPVFDREASMTIGDIAVNWATRHVWVGTGEANSSRSSYAGTGVYKSTDLGKTWKNLGLPESHHISRVVLHPTQPNTAWVGVLGHLYTPNQERGIFMTQDGGITWKQTLYVNDTTGVIDLDIDPQDPQILYAATWTRTRSAWHFEGAGSGSAIHKSTDGGLTWTKITGVLTGFPEGPKTGRIGLSAGLRDGKTIVYASLDNQNAKPKKDEKKVTGLTKDTLRNMTDAVYLKLEKEKKEDFLKANDFPEKYTVEVVDSLIRTDSLITPRSLVEYLEDANSALFEANYIGAEVYSSEDGGKTWQKTHADPLEQIHFTYGYYFSNIRCDARNANRVYLLGFLIIASEDGGKTWKSINQDNVHVDHHALWVNSQKPGHIINGNDGGLNMSYDNGENWSKLNSPAVGQLYTIHADMADPFNIYMGNQDNGVWVGPSNYTSSREWEATGKYPYQEIMGGDGMQIQVDTRDNRTVYTGYQFGNYFRIDRFSGKTTYITPRHELGERPLRFNWQTPIHLSKHNQDILYMGANKVYRSMDKGETWTVISDDLTKGGKVGNVPFGTITSLHESKLHFGLLYAGTDDGNVWVSRNGGFEWKNISSGLPANLWVTRVQASSHVKGRVYASLNGYRQDHFAAYCYVSDDFGTTWRKIGSDLPAEPVNVIKEDPTKPHLVYVGTDHQLYVSTNSGAQFSVLSDSMPHVPVHDLDFHAPSHTLLVGTHGRSAYSVDLSHLHALPAQSMDSTFVLLKIEKLKQSKAWGKKIAWKETLQPKLKMAVYLKSGQTLNYAIVHDSGIEVAKGAQKTHSGINNLQIPIVCTESARNKLEKTLNKPVTDKKSTEVIVLSPADDGNVYLPKAKYKIKFDSGREFAFEIE